MADTGYRMEKVAAPPQGTEVDVQRSSSTVQPQADSSRTAWSNGQCVLALRSGSALNPIFDLSVCRARLESDGFQIPVTDMELPLTAALDVPAIRRYMLFNSAVFQLVLAPSTERLSSLPQVLYVVLWCSLFSTLHLYLRVPDYWVLCLCVSLVSIFLTTAIIFILHHSNKEMNLNLDARLIQVNERLVKHQLLVCVADCLQGCSGHTQLFFVYWDMSPCLRTLTQTLEEHNIQNKLRKKLAHFVLVSEAKTEAEAEAEVEAEAGHPEWDLEQGPEEQRPLLGGEPSCTRSQVQEFSTNHSLIPDASLPAQTQAYQLLLTFSAVYVKLLVSQRLSGPSHHRLRPLRNHCSSAPFCLCQYINRKILQ